MKTGKISKVKKIIIIAVAVIVVLAVACGIYFGSYYHAEPEAYAAAENLPAGITSRTEKLEGVGEVVIFEPENAAAGMIFYPGGKVEYTAYEPLMRDLAEQGVFCVLLKVNANLAILDPNAADGVREQFPNITDWYLGGHSLGGLMASSYAAKHTDEFKGLLLLGAYSTKDLSNTDLAILSVYGTEDGIMNRNNYEKNKANLGDFKEVIVEGGCHSYFGSYGMQKGDGPAMITREEQLAQTAEAFQELLSK